MHLAKLLLILTLGSFALAGCEQEGPAEDTGEAVDEAVEDAGNAVEDACEDVKEGVDAEDTDC